MAVQLLYNSSYGTYLQGNDSIQALQLYREALRDQRTVWQKVIDFLGNLFGYEPDWQTKQPSENLQTLYNVLHAENQAPQSVINGILKLCENAEQKNKVKDILLFCQHEGNYTLACKDDKGGVYKYDFCRFEETAMPEGWVKNDFGNISPLYQGDQCIANVAANEGATGSLSGDEEAQAGCSRDSLPVAIPETAVGEQVFEKLSTEDKTLFLQYFDKGIWVEILTLQQTTPENYAQELLKRCKTDKKGAFARDVCFVKEGDAYYLGLRLSKEGGVVYFSDFIKFTPEKMPERIREGNYKCYYPLLNAGLIQPVYNDFPQNVSLKKPEILGKGGIGTVTKQQVMVPLPKFLQSISTEENTTEITQLQKTIARKTMHPDTLSKNAFVKEKEVIDKLPKSAYLNAHIGNDSTESIDLECAKMDVWDSANKHKYDGLTVARSIGDAARGLDALHNEGYAHRDIKQENLLVTAEHIQLGDFGYTVQVNEAMEKFIGTAAYTPPEMVGQQALPKDYNPRSADIWALGATLLELVLGGTYNNDLPGETPAYKAELVLQEIKGDLTNELGEEQGENRVFIPLILAMLSDNWRDRPSADDVVTQLTNISNQLQAVTGMAETLRRTLAKRYPIDKQEQALQSFISGVVDTDAKTLSYYGEETFSKHSALRGCIAVRCTPINEDGYMSVPLDKQSAHYKSTNFKDEMLYRMFSEQQGADTQEALSEILKQLVTPKASGAEPLLNGDEIEKIVKEVMACHPELEPAPQNNGVAVEAVPADKPGNGQ